MTPTIARSGRAHATLKRSHVPRVPPRYDGVTAIGVDDHVWRHTRPPA